MFGAQSLKSALFLVQSSASLLSRSPELLIEIDPIHGQYIVVLGGVEGIALDSFVFTARKPLANMYRHSEGQRLLLDVQHNE